MDDDTVRHRQQCARRLDRGFTYVEAVITVVLMGVVVLPILAAVRGSIQAASVSRDAAEVETILVNAVDRVDRADRADFPCDLTAPAVAAVEASDWEHDDVASLVTVEHAYLDDDGSWTTDGTGTACPGGILPPRNLIQRISISVTSPDGDVTRTIEVIKSDV